MGKPEALRSLRAGGGLAVTSPQSTQSPTGTASAGLRKWPLLALLAGLILVGDQVSKYLAVEHLTAAFQVAHAHTFGEKLSAYVSQRELLERGLTTGAYDVFRSWWQMRYTENPGAAFSFLAGTHGPWRVLFFHLITLGALLFIFSTYRKLRDDQRWMQVALALLLGGALGNGIDRAIRGYVIDFIAWHVNDADWMSPDRWRHWPTFNVADCGVTVGLIMLVLAMLTQKDALPAQKPAARAGSGREAIAPARR